MKKRILLIGNLSNIHLLNYTKNVLSNVDAEIIALNTNSDYNNIPVHFVKTYKEIGVLIIAGPPPSIITKKLGHLRYRIAMYQCLNKLGNFDYLHMHYVSNAISLIVYVLKKNYRNIILSYWGSDLYRTGKLQRIECIPLLLSSSAITLVTNDMLNTFLGIPYYQKFKKRCCIMDFGDPFYGKIDEFKKDDLPFLKRKLGVNPDKIAIVVGYNGTNKMRQYEVLKSTLPLLQKYLDKIEIVLPVLYMDANSIQIIKECLIKTGIEYKLFPNYMDEEMVSLFRVITQIFIHVQDTDALSNSMLESLYAGAVVINGKWLKYQELDDINCFYLKTNSISELGPVIEDTINNFEKYLLMACNNKNKIYSISSWDVLKDKWLKLYRN